MPDRVDRRGFLQLSAAAAAAFLTRRASAAERRSNLVLILADDVSPEHYGCYGGKQANTPNLDRLAETGVKFETCWACPICSPTRAMIMTGRYATRTGWYHNSLKIPPPGATGDFKLQNHTFSALLKAAGYATVIAGKWQLPGWADDPAGGFDEHCLWEPGEKKLPPGSTFTGLREDPTTLARYWHPSYLRNRELVPTTANDFGPDICCDFVCDFISRHRDQPWLCYWPMTLPHRARKGYTTTPQVGQPGDHVNGTIQTNTDYTDVLVGRLLDHLEQLGLRDNTLVVYVGDNGYPGKNTATAQGARVPMIAHGPGLVKARGDSLELASFADLLPTLLDYAGVPLPDGYEVDGRSLQPYLSGQTEQHSREFLFSYCGTARMIRDRRYVLEAVDPVYGTAEGRLLDTAGSARPTEYREVDEPTVDEQAAQQRLTAALAQIPWINFEDPQVKAKLEKYATDQYRHRLRFRQPQK